MGIRYFCYQCVSEVMHPDRIFAIAATVWEEVETYDEDTGYRTHMLRRDQILYRLPDSATTCMKIHDLILPIMNRNGDTPTHDTREDLLEDFGQFWRTWNRSKMILITDEPKGMGGNLFNVYTQISQDTLTDIYHKGINDIGTLHTLWALSQRKGPNAKYSLDEQLIPEVEKWPTNPRHPMRQVLVNLATWWHISHQLAGRNDIIYPTGANV